MPDATQEDVYKIFSVLKGEEPVSSILNEHTIESSNEITTPIPSASFGKYGESWCGWSVY